ncbi:MAG: hypothetical protein AAF383_17435 [Cyanobacteria bacterium P01_A01_bin.83]
MPNKPFSFRLPPDVVEEMEASKKENESLNQLAQRVLIEKYRGEVDPSAALAPLQQQEVKQIVQAQLKTLQERLDDLEGKLVA